jgi:hypothetical protein
MEAVVRVMAGPQALVLPTRATGTNLSHITHPLLGPQGRPVSSTAVVVLPPVHVRALEACTCPQATAVPLMTVPTLLVVKLKPPDKLSSLSSSSCCRARRPGGGGLLAAAGFLPDPPTPAPPLLPPPVAPPLPPAGAGERAGALLVGPGWPGRAGADPPAAGVGLLLLRGGVAGVPPAPLLLAPAVLFLGAAGPLPEGLGLGLRLLLVVVLVVVPELLPGGLVLPPVAGRGLGLGLRLLLLLPLPLPPVAGRGLGLGLRLLLLLLPPPVAGRGLGPGLLLGAVPLLLPLLLLGVLGGVGPAAPPLLLLLLLLLWVVLLGPAGLGACLGVPGGPATGLPLAMLLRLVPPAASPRTPSAWLAAAELVSRIGAQLLALLLRAVRPLPPGQRRVGSRGAMVGASPQAPKLYRSKVRSRPMRYIVQPGMVWLRRISLAYMPSHWV